MEGLRGASAEIVAVERHVQSTAGHLGALDLTDQAGETPSQRQAPGLDTDQDEALGALVRLEQFMCEAAEHPRDVLAAEEVGRAGHVDPLPGLTGPVVKGAVSSGEVADHLDAAQTLARARSSARTPTRPLGTQPSASSAAPDRARVSSLRIDSSTPLTKRPESSVDSRLARSIASSITTAAGVGSWSSS